MAGTDEIEALYRRHASAVLRFAWGLSGDRGVAEEIVAETFFRLLTRPPRIETQTALAYLLAIARNVFLSGCRRRRREVPLPEGLLAPEVDPARRIDQRARLEAVLRALSDLPEGERTAHACASRAPPHTKGEADEARRDARRGE